MATILLVLMAATAASVLCQGVIPDISPPLVTFDCSASKPQTTTQINRHGALIVQKTWPWMALVGKRDTQDVISWLCAGMLINEQWVLSNVKCLLDQASSVVRLGEYDYADDLDGANHQDFSLADIVIYPDYSPDQMLHDLVLLKLDSIVSFEKDISPVCLPWGTESNRDITDQKAVVFTYGMTFSSAPTLSTVQKKLELTVFPTALCDVNYSKLPQYGFSYPQGIGQETLCASDREGGKDACKGDSGGPLMTLDASGRYVVAGMVSHGHGCGDVNFPGLYNNLRYPPYLDWIKRVAFTTP